MIRTFLLFNLLFCLGLTAVNAQNNFPLTGNVGIGVNPPGAPFGS